MKCTVAGSRVGMALLLIAVAAPGCYLSHGRGDGADGGSVPMDSPHDVAPDVPVDAGPPDAPADAFVPDGAVTVPCQPGTLAPGGGRPPSCAISAGGDHDGDGFANADDCDDCGPQVSPGAYDFPGNAVDEDCDGSDDGPCDDAVEGEDPGTPLVAARAIGICATTTEAARTWGVISGRFTTPDGVGAPADPIQLGALARFGSFEPLQGETLLAISSGVARVHPRGESVCMGFGAGSDFPPGFPVVSPACPGVSSGPPFDGVALELTLRVPTNARGLRFASAFYTHEYPDYICSPYNDVFAVHQLRDDGLENITFDAAGNPVTVNNALLRACLPGTHGDREFRCELGYDLLRRTGYDRGCPELHGGTRENAGASTGCIETTSAVVPGSVITLRFSIWDSGDDALDSLAWIDDFRWVLQDFQSVR